MFLQKLFSNLKFIVKEKNFLILGKKRMMKMFEIKKVHFLKYSFKCRLKEEIVK